MPRNLVNLLISQVNSLDSTIDTSVGSNFRDLLIEPVARILSDYEVDHERVINNLSLEDPTLFTQAELDALGKNFLVERNLGANHVGSIQLFYREPVAVSLPAGTRFRHAASGNLYELVNRVEFTRLTIQGNPSLGLFHTPNISVRSVEKRDSAALNALARLEPVGSLNPAPERVEVAEDIDGGSSQESNPDFYQRILQSVRSTSLASKQAIELNVKEAVNTIQDAQVVGAGDSFMIRDRVAYSQLTQNVVEDFFLVSQESEDYKNHRAFLGIFSADEVTNSGQASSPQLSTDFNDWDQEFSLAQYKGLYKPDDSIEAEQQHLIYEDVEAWGEENLSNYTLSDGSKEDNSLVFPDEIRIEGDSLILGKTPDTNRRVDVRLTLDELKQIEEDLGKSAVSKDGDTLLQSLKKQLEEKLDPEVYGDMSPIAHRQIPTNSAIEINSRISTNDGTAFGQMFYMTTFRNDKVFIPHDGYGLAYRKQPDFLIRLNEDDYQDPDLREQDIQTFIDLFDEDPEEEGLIGNDELRTGEGNDKYWLFNIYLVDNNALSEEVQMGTSKIFDAINGINQYLQRSKYWIEPEEEYDFRVRIDANLATRI